MNIWTEERIAILREFHEAGLTASQIAQRLSIVVTKDMVRGQLKRLRREAEAEAMRQEAECQEAARLEAEAEAKRQEAERQEAKRQEAERLEAEARRLEAERRVAEAKRLEVEAQRRETERQEAERQEAEAKAQEIASKATPPGPRSWSTELTEKLVALNQQGRTSNQIAAELGITRNMVCGKLDRLKQASGLKPKAVHKRTRMKALRASPAAIPGPTIVPTPAAPKAGPECVVAIEKRRSGPSFGSMFLLDLGKDDCRFATEDHPGEMQRHRFCGRPVEPGYEYCPHHCLAAFNFVDNPKEKIRLQRICEDVGMAA